MGNWLEHRPDEAIVERLEQRMQVEDWPVQSFSEGVSEKHQETPNGTKSGRGSSSAAVSLLLAQPLGGTQVIEQEAQSGIQCI